MDNAPGDGDHELTILTAKQRHAKMPGDVRALSVDFDHALDAGETIDQVTVEQRGGSDLMILPGQPSEDPLTILDNLVPAGRAVQLGVGGGSRGTDYRLRVTVETSQGQTISTDLILQVR